MSPINSKIKDDFQVVLLLSCFVGRTKEKIVKKYENVQPLDPNHLPCCTCYTAPQAAVMEINCTCPTSVPSNFTIPTAAILPPPPSFLAPYTSPVQTVPLQTGGKEGNRFITLPRHTR